MNDPWSTHDPRFRAAIDRWLATNAEVLLLRRRPVAASNKDWFFVRSFTELDVVIGRSHTADCLSAFADPQLATRGAADDALLGVALAQLDAVGETVFAEVVEGDPQLLDGLAALAGEEERVTRWFAARRGRRVAFGPYPPFLSEDLSRVVEGIVPMGNGSVARGVY
jgi:hypothetical protein